jgi:hypothetical protein
MKKPSDSQIDGLVERKYSLFQASIASACSHAMIQNRISRGLLPMPMEGTGGLRLFSILDIAKLSLMGELTKKGIAALPASMVANTVFGTYSDPAIHIISDIGNHGISGDRIPVASWTAAQRQKFLGLQSFRGKNSVRLMVDSGEVIRKVKDRISALPPVRHRGRPRKNTKQEQ